MRTAFATVAVLLCLVVVSDRWSEGQAQSAPPVSPQRALIDQYCMGCHSDRLKSGGLALSQLNLDAPGDPGSPGSPGSNVQSPGSNEIAEKVIRKLRGGLMPPAGARRPDSHATAEFVSWLENKIDTGATESKPGRVPLRRLNRREYGYAIRDLLGLDIDATAWLPDDNIKGNFDNNAAALQVSPNFIDQYVYAALAAGASGFLLKDVTPDHLVNAVRLVRDGDALLAPAITRRLVARFARPDAPAVAHRQLGTLTPREREVLVLLAGGLSNLELAAALHLGEATIKTHVTRILAKLSLRDRVQAVVLAYESGLIQPGTAPSAQNPQAAH